MKNRPETHKHAQGSPTKGPSMSVALALGLGFFVLTAVASVLAVGLVSGYRNTIDLLHQKAELLVNSEVNQTLLYLESARDQVDFIVEQVATGEVEAGPSDEFISLITGALAATPQIISLQFIDQDNRSTGIERQNSGTALLLRSIREDDDLKQRADEVRDSREPLWGAPLWREEYRQATLNYHAPAILDDEQIGVISTLISTQRLSESISGLETTFGANAFILYGRDKVLAHSLLSFGYDDLTRLIPLPEQAVFGDPVISSIWEEQHPNFIERSMLTMPGIRFVRLGDQGFIVLSRKLEGYTDRSMIVGTYLPSIDLLSEVQRLKWAIILCIGISILPALTAAFIGRQIAQPVKRLSQGALKVHDFELEEVEPLPGSFFRELNDASNSFNTMLGGLRWFERYVPKSLVRRLIRLHGEDGIDSSYRSIAVMFTDIVGFSQILEHMTAPEAAALLNRHFTMLAECVEVEGGTIDKFDGDSLMAFWGAPEPHEDYADRACRAALLIKREIEKENNVQREACGPVLRLRIGMCTGRVVVGNIGSPGRINYTAVGNAVNVARRLEELGKAVGRTEEDANILVSSSLRSALVKPFSLAHLGSHKLRGRTERTDVYGLEQGESGANQERPGQ